MPTNTNSERAKQESIRVAIYVDYSNFALGYKKRFNTPLPKAIWREFNERILARYQKVMKKEHLAIDHVGTFLTVGISEEPCDSEKALRRRTEYIDELQGYIFNYAGRKLPDGGNMGQEKGVDVDLVCQMLVDAFFDHYDQCILVTDDTDFIPCVERIQHLFGKQVIQAGYTKSALRRRAYGHLCLSDADENLDWYWQNPSQGDHGSQSPSASSTHPSDGSSTPAGS